MPFNLRKGKASSLRPSFPVLYHSVPESSLITPIQRAFGISIDPHLSPATRSYKLPAWQRSVPPTLEGEVLRIPTSPLPHSRVTSINTSLLKLLKTSKQAIFNLSRKFKKKNPPQTWDRQSHYLIKDLGDNILIQDGDIGGAVGYHGPGQGVCDGEFLGHQAMDLEPGFGGHVRRAKNTDCRV